MVELITEDKPLPLLRKDLELYEGPNEADGSPTFNLYDPVIAKYYKINWAESLVLEYQKPGMTLSQLTEEINKSSTLKVTDQEIKFFFIDAFRHNLLSLMKSPEYYNEAYKQRNDNIIKWLLFNYLYIRIPLFNPDKFLSKTVKYVAPLGSTIAFSIYGVLSFIGIILLFTRFGEFINTFTYFFNFEGIIIYALAITAVKVVHELSHAYTAKKFNVYVPSMGIALIVLWPVLYTDVTDGWKLKKRKERLLISLAGIIAELIIAGFATIGWYYAPKGYLQGICFVIASVTWISTLIINLNPAIKFDGYYILGDIWGIDNLQTRSFNVTRWKLRQVLLGLTGPCPEERLSHKRMVGMIVYSIFTWIYRIFLYTAIALFVYFQFTKALGVFLFFMEVAIFIVWPLASEIKAISNMRASLKVNPRLMLTVTLLVFFLGWLILPLPHSETFPAISKPIDQQVIYMPLDSIIREIHVERNEVVSKGDPLISLYSPSLETEIRKYELEKEILEKQVYLLGYYEKDRAFIPEKRAELASNSEKLSGFLTKRNELNVKASLNGTVYLWDDMIKVGMPISKDTVIGKVADPNKIEIQAFIPEDDVDIVNVGQKVQFRITDTNDLFQGEIKSISPLRKLTLEHLPLASIYYGDLAVSEDKQSGVLKMVDAYYTAVISIDKKEAQLRFGQTGVVEVEGPWRSKIGTIFKKILSIFWRESGV